MTRTSFGEAYASKDGFDRSVRSLLAWGVSFSSAADIAQTAWLRLWQFKSRIRDDARFGAYVGKTVRHLAIDVVRRDQRLDQFPVNCGQPGPDDIRLDAIDVRRVLGKLKPRQRQLLELTYFEGLSGGEIALRYALRPAAVHSALARARNAFARTYRENSQ